MVFPANYHRIESTPSGSLGLDICLGKGGYPPGTIIEISGEPESGKTTLCLHAVASAQRQQKYCAWIDADPWFSREYAYSCGVLPSRIYYSVPGSSKQALDTILVLSSSGVFSFIVLDSLSSLLLEKAHFLNTSDPKSEIDYDLLSLQLTSISSSIKKTGATILITNWYQAALSKTYHNLSPYIGRLSLNLHASIRIRLETIGKLLKEEFSTGQRVNARNLEK